MRQLHQSNAHITTSWSSTYESAGCIIETHIRLHHDQAHLRKSQSMRLVLAIRDEPLQKVKSLKKLFCVSIALAILSDNIWDVSWIRMLSGVMPGSTHTVPQAEHFLSASEKSRKSWKKHPLQFLQVKRRREANFKVWSQFSSWHSAHSNHFLQQGDCMYTYNVSRISSRQ